MASQERNLLGLLANEPGYAPNLAAAQNAVAYVREKLTMGADNRVWDKGRALFSNQVMELNECVANVKDPYLDISIPDDPVLPSWIIKAAAKAETAGCGNCREQAAVALVYLFNKKHVRVVDFMRRTDIDHAFVVIGRETGSDLSDYKTWGAKCIVCDPWDEKAFAAADIPKYAYKSSRFSVDSRFRYPTK
jgi:hypothetical protein